MPGLLQQPFPSFNPSIRGVIICLIAGIAVILVLVVLKPFYFATLPLHLQWSYATAYGLCTIIVSILNTVLLPYFFPKLFKELGWTVGKEMLFFIWLLFCVAVGNVLTSYWLDGSRITWNGLLSACVNTVAVGVVPVFLSIIIKQQLLVRKFKNEALRADDGLFKEQVNAPIVLKDMEGTIVISSDAKGELLEVAPVNLLYINAADNYAKLVFLENGVVTNKLLRTTLKTIETQLASYPQFYRCHRTYIINLEKVIHISGNAQGYKLHLNESADIIPVSRNLNTTITQKLNTIRLNKQQPPMKY
ncbi:MAG: hypothetical protein RLZZ316_2682 [Bacteroidota bacterium]|jgi:hypothetical protein